MFNRHGKIIIFTRQGQGHQDNLKINNPSKLCSNIFFGCIRRKVNLILKAPKVAFKRELCTDIFQIYQNKLCFIISAQRLTMTKIRINSRYSNFLNNTISWVDKITMLLRYMLLKDKIVQMNTGFKVWF